MLFVRFSTGQERRESTPFGPFDFIQNTYGRLSGFNEPGTEETVLADFDPDRSVWVTPDRQWWSDFNIFPDDKNA